MVCVCVSSLVSWCVLISRLMPLYLYNVLLLKSCKEDYAGLKDCRELTMLVTSTEVMTLVQPSVLKL